jgi:peptidoglycan/LPS O-acetylase OafA/YrhL
MYARSVKTLTLLIALLGVGELVSAVIIWKENYADAEPAFAVLFAVIFGGCAALLRLRKVVAGTVLATVLCLFEVVSFPSWTRHNALDWVYQATFAAIATAGLVTSVAVMVGRRRALAGSPGPSAR